MAIIKQYDKRSGITYAYESHSYWAVKLEEACATALSYTQSPSYKSVSNILAASKDSASKSAGSDPDTPKSNTNGITRGADYYRRK